MININYNEVKKLSLEHLQDKVLKYRNKYNINAPAGNNHYRLLAYMSQKINNSLIIINEIKNVIFFTLELFKY